MAIIYRKTTKGVTEIETRAHKLAPRVRNALILVDGKRNDAELAAMILQQAAETLLALAEQGFIEALVPVTISNTTAPSPSPSPSEARTSTPTLRREAVRALTELVGPLGDIVAMRVERARSIDEWRAAVVLAVQIIGNTRGKEAANAYAARFGEF